MSFCKRNNLLAVLFLVAVFTSMHLLYTSRLDMAVVNCIKYQVANACRACEATQLVTTSVPASVPDNVNITYTNARQISGTDTIPTPEPSAGNVPNEEDYYLEKTTTNFSMEDPGFLQYLRSNILIAPLPIPYNLDDPFGDPTVKEGQNKVILELLKNKRNGLFVEAGANQGEYLSNTLVLERDFGWTGLLVEPDEVSFQTLLSKHRRAWAANVCLSTEKKPGKLEFLYNRRYPIVSHLAEKSKIEKNSNPLDLDRKVVKCVPIFSLLLAINLTDVDYFSLDVEGAELDVLKTIPFDRVRIRTMSIEFDHIVRIPGGDEELKTLMKNNGFRLVTQVTTGYAKDYIFAHSSL